MYPLHAPAVPVVAATATRTETGGTTQINGKTVTTWAKVRTDDGSVTEVGIILPVALAENPPEKPGTGPLGAVAVIPFPRSVRQTTYFDHFELHWNPHGHPPMCCMNVPHYDFHFYGVPLALVKQVAPPDSGAPIAARLPEGYVYPGVNECVPEMGVHTLQPSEVKPGHILTADMVAGFYHGQMNFIEPMISCKVLEAHKSFSLAVPRPAELGRATRYPTKFTATFDASTKSWKLVYSDFTAFAK